MEEKKSINDEVDLMDYLIVLKKRKYFVMGFVCLSLFLMLIISLLIPKKYKVDSLIKLGKVNNAYTINPKNAIELLNTQLAGKAVIADLKKKKLFDKLKSFLSDTNKMPLFLRINKIKQTEQISKTDFIKIEVIFTDPQLTYEICQSLVNFIVDFGNKRINKENYLVENQIQENEESFNEINVKLNKVYAILKSLKMESQLKIGFYQNIFLESLIINLEKEQDQVHRNQYDLKKYLLKIEKFEVLNKPILPFKKFKPKIIKNLLITLIISFFLGIFLVFFL